LRQVERAFVEVVNHATRGADDDMHAATQRRELRAVALTAVNGEYMESGDMHGIALKGFGDLNRQFARRSEHNGLRGGLFQIDARQNGQREGSGLAGAGLGLTQDVAIGEEMRNGSGLNGRRRFIANLFQCSEQRLAQIKVREESDFRHRGTHKLLISQNAK